MSRSQGGEILEIHRVWDGLSDEAIQETLSRCRMEMDEACVELAYKMKVSRFSFDARCPAFPEGATGALEKEVLLFERRSSQQYAGKLPVGVEYTTNVVPVPEVEGAVAQRKVFSEGDSSTPALFFALGFRETRVMVRDGRRVGFPDGVFVDLYTELVHRSVEPGEKGRTRSSVVIGVFCEPDHRAAAEEAGHRLAKMRRTLEPFMSRKM